MAPRESTRRSGRNGAYAGLQQGHIVLGLLIVALGVVLWMRTEPCASAKKEGMDPSVRWTTGGLAGPWR